MPKPETLPKLRKLASQYLVALRAAAQAVASGEEGDPGLATTLSDRASRFAAAAVTSRELARAIEVSPGLAALSVASKELSDLATKRPELAELAVVSPNLARVAALSPEMGELAKSSPPLAAMIEAMLARR